MKTLIIGGGLSGLALAEALERHGQDYLLVEARPRFGGRIMTEAYNGRHFDMGPAWFWPGQPRIATLIARLGLEKFDQFADGTLTFEDETGRVERGRGFASMQGSWRLKGGLTRLTDNLANRLPNERKQLDAQVTQLANTSTGIVATLASGTTLTADCVVLCLPPRIAAELTFFPALPSASLQTMQTVATWMAGQSKAVAVYDTPFWREAGLSGDAMSRKGPMVEIHDASADEDGPFALFGFIGVPPRARSNEQILRQHLIAQLERLFGPDAGTPEKLFVKDWASDPLTATPADQAPLYTHPTYGLPASLADLWDGRLYFGGTEVASQFGGYIEGALEAAENVLVRLAPGSMEIAHAK